MTVKSGAYDGILSGVKDDPLTKWGGGGVYSNDWRSDFATSQWQLRNGILVNEGTITTENLVDNGNGGLHLDSESLAVGADSVPKVWTSDSTAANTNMLVSNGTSAGDVSADGFCWAMVVRFNSAILSEAEYILSKYSLGLARGWGVNVNGTNIQFFLAHGGGVFSVNNTPSQFHTAPFLNKWVWLKGKYTSVDDISIKGDAITNQSSISSAINLVNVATPLVVNGLDPAVTGNWGQANVQVAYVAVQNDGVDMYEGDLVINQD